MSFIIGKKCISTCDTACVDVCPVDCIHGPIDITGGGSEYKIVQMTNRRMIVEFEFKNMKIIYYRKQN